MESSLLPPKTHTNKHNKDLLILLIDNGDVDDEMLKACLKIQKMIRSKKARSTIKKMLVSIWRKRYDTSSGYYFYENQINGETVWDPPRAFAMFFPDLDW